MEYIYGTIRRDGVMVENLKTVGAEHTDLAGYIETQQDFGSAGVITDRCRILEHYHTDEADGLCYDWYLIDRHYRYMDTSTSLQEIQRMQEESANEALLMGQVSVAARIYLRERTDIQDEDALRMPQLFRTWQEALDAEGPLAADSILNKDGTLYRVMQAVTPLESQPPGGEGMLAIYRPIDQTHTGTAEDPIPWTYGMDCTAGLYYSYESGVWLCKGDMTPCVWAPGTAGVYQWEVA